MQESPTTHSLKSLLEAELANEAISLKKEQVAKEKEEKLVLLQENAPFSESIVWDLQRKYYTDQGVKAWSEGVVPHYITSSSYMAKSYAHLALAWLEDQIKAGKKSLRILELGAGSGQFTFHFLRHIETLWFQKYPETNDLPFIYVMSDVSDENLAFWSTHPNFQEWYEQGTLDSAYFDVENDQELTLDRAEVKWSKENNKEPLLVIANYIFDTIRQDYWEIGDDEARQIQVASFCKEGAMEEPSLQSLSYEYSTANSSENNYKDNAINELIDFYAQNLQTGVVSIPNYGKACINNLKSWCDNRLTLLSGDKGEVNWRAFTHAGLPELAQHGSISTTVNYHAFHWMVGWEGGASWGCGQPGDEFKVNAFTWGKPDELCSFSKQCEDYEEQFSPADQFVIKRVIEGSYSVLTVHEILSYLRFSTYDPKALKRAMPRLAEIVSQLTAHQLFSIEKVIVKTWDNYYPLGEQDDLAFLIASFFYEADLYVQALFFFERSAELYGHDEGTLVNMQNCKKLINENLQI